MCVSVRIVDFYVRCVHSPLSGSIWPHAFLVLYLIMADLQFSKRCQLIALFTLLVFIPGFLNREICPRITATTIAILFSIHLQPISVKTSLHPNLGHIFLEVEVSLWLWYYFHLQHEVWSDKMHEWVPSGMQVRVVTEGGGMGTGKTCQGGTIMSKFKALHATAKK